jgi:RecB family endonuclease NucS
MSLSNHEVIAVTKRNVIYVERSVVTTERVAMIVVDEADMKAQLLKHEQLLREFKYVSKPDRDKQGKIEFHVLNNDWDIHK